MKTMTLIPMIRRILVRWLWPERSPNWSEEAAELSFRFSLGEAARLLISINRPIAVYLPQLCQTKKSVTL